MIAPADILRELVAIPSVSSQSNRPIIQWIQQWFESLHWHSRAFSYTDAQGLEKANLVVSPSPLPEGVIEAELAVVCHSDTVPFSASWAEATNLRKIDGMLHGCGACDVKGFLACMLMTASHLDANNIHKRLVFVFTSDEEIGCRGSRFLFDQKVLRARYAIVGEPTSLAPARAGKGYGLAEVTVAGKSAHSAYPGSGKSAILAAAHLITAIEDLGSELEADRNEAFSPAWTTLNIGEIRGGTAKNVIPAECWFLVEWRPIPSQDADLVAKRLQQLAAECSKDGIEVSVKVTRTDPGFETSSTSPVIAALQHDGVQVQTLAFGTEAPWMARMGAEAVVFGPGSMLTAHSPRECVPIKELDDCVQILRAAIEQLCG